MSEWDRKALLLLVDEVGANLHAAELSTDQRHALQSLMAQYGSKAKSILACRQDVVCMEQQLSRILGTSDNNP